MSAQKEPTKLFRWINIDLSGCIDQKAVTVPEEYKHLSRKELAEQHPEVINAMKAATLDDFYNHDLLTDFDYMMADLYPRDNRAWEYANLRLFNDDEIKQFREKEKQRAIDLKALQQKQQEDQKRRTLLANKMADRMWKDPSFEEKLEKLLQE